MDVKWTRTALANLASITSRIEADKPERAKSFVQEIRTKTNVLATWPNIGREGRVAGTRELVVHKNYIVIYRLNQGNIEILRVHHATRQWPDLGK